MKLSLVETSRKNVEEAKDQTYDKQDRTIWPRLSTCVHNQLSRYHKIVALSETGSLSQSTSKEKNSLRNEVERILGTETPS
jgi:hypothetical protein